MKRVGQIVRRKREALGLSLSKLARLVGAAKSYLSMIENDRVANPPSRHLLAALQQALGIEDDALMRAADWQLTPAPVRHELTQVSDHARRGRELAQWLKTSAESHAVGGKSLDKLFRSGELAQRIERTLAPSAGHDNVALEEVAFGRVPLINKVAAGQPCEFTDLDMPVSMADEYVYPPPIGAGVPGLNDPQAFAARIIGESMQPQFSEGDVVIFSPAAPVTDGCDCFVRLEDGEVTFKRIFFEAGPTQRLRLQPLNPRFAPRVVARESVSGLYRAVWRWQKLAG